MSDVQENIWEEEGVNWIQEEIRKYDDDINLIPIDVSGDPRAQVYLWLRDLIPLGIGI